MSKKMLIDAAHSEETRVVVVENGRVEELDVDTSTKKQIKGNIYLAKIIRVEPSLQAAFVDYGGNRHGFLAFGEIHPDYYQIPVADREALKAMIAARQEEDDVESDSKKEDVEVVSELEETPRQKMYFYKRYKIQEVIRQGQVMLVQVVKEERGNKGAALTTYLSLAGRYSVLMPNNGKGGGVSRKITNIKDRKFLRNVVEKLPIPAGMSVIIRTAGQGKTKTEIKRDYDYLIKTWMKIRENTLESLAPKLIHEEGDIVKRSLRDVFSPDIDEIWVEGESIFKSAKDFMKMLMPGQAKKVKQYKGADPLFLVNQIEAQLEAIHSNIVQLKSGGYLVIDQTEALVAVDVNSGRATREHDIEETALRINLETCDELARQLRLRDLAGLIVIDFIDMEEAKNNAAVERHLKEVLKRDRARIQVGRMSGFGLMEMSRQRLHSSFLESSYHVCPHCGGKGMIRSVESCAMHALHILEEACLKNKETNIVLSLPQSVAAYVLNNKRKNLTEMENRYACTVTVGVCDSLEKMSDYKLERLREDGEQVSLSLTAHSLKNTDKKQNEFSRRGKAVFAEEASAEKKMEFAETEEEGGFSWTNKNRKRYEWRKKRRDRQRYVNADETSPETDIADARFTVVKQQSLEDFNQTPPDVPEAAETATPETEDKTNKFNKPPKKYRSFKSRHAAKVQRELEENQKTAGLTEVSDAGNETSAAVVHETETPVSETVENTDPKKKKRGWWNKFVNSDNA